MQQGGESGLLPLRPPRRHDGGQRVRQHHRDVRPESATLLMPGHRVRHRLGRGQAEHPMHAVPRAETRGRQPGEAALPPGDQVRAGGSPRPSRPARRAVRRSRRRPRARRATRPRTRPRTPRPAPPAPAAAPSARPPRARRARRTGHSTAARPTGSSHTRTSPPRRRPPAPRGAPSGRAAPHAHRAFARSLPGRSRPRPVIRARAAGGSARRGRAAGRPADRADQMAGITPNETRAMMTTPRTTR